MKIFKVSELKNYLPIGIKDENGKWHREFSLRPYKGKTDRLLALWDKEQESLKDKDQRQYEIKKVAKHIALMLERVGDLTFPTDKDGNALPSTELAVLGMNLADVMYLYIYLRIKALGNDLTIPFVCPSCGHRTGVSIDMTQIEVHVPEKPEQAAFWVKLSSPLVVKDNFTINSFYIEPLKFHSLANHSNLTVNNSMDLFALQETVTKVNEHQGGTSYHLSDSELDELDKKDILHLTAEASKCKVGPEPVVDVECPKCHTETPNILDWSHTFFFEQSFLLTALNP